MVVSHKTISAGFPRSLDTWSILSWPFFWLLSENLLIDILKK
jgi:hypothetical protein